MLDLNPFPVITISFLILEYEQSLICSLTILFALSKEDPCKSIVFYPVLE